MFRFLRLQLALLPFLWSMWQQDLADPPKDDPQDPPKDDGKTFTQADVDRMMAARETRDRDKLRRELEPDIRARIEADAKTAALKEQQEFKPLYEAEQAKATAAETALQEREAAYQARLIRADVRTAAAQLNVLEPDDVYHLLDLSAVTLNGEGEPTNVAALVKALVEAKPYLVKQETREGIPATRRGDGSGEEKPSERALSYLAKRYAREQAAS